MCDSNDVQCISVLMRFHLKSRNPISTKQNGDLGPGTHHHQHSIMGKGYSGHGNWFSVLSSLKFWGSLQGSHSSCGAVPHFWVALPSCVYTRVREAHHARLTYARPPTNYTPFRENPTQRVSVANDGVIWIGGLSVAKTGMIKSRPRRAKRVSRVPHSTRSYAARSNRQWIENQTDVMESRTRGQLAGRVTTADFGTKLVASRGLTAKCQSIPARVRGRRACSSSQSIL